MSQRVVIVGGGAAGFFTAITAAERRADLEVVLLEKAPRFLGKVRISGGGRCNVTHAEFDPRVLVENYPRGRKELLGPFHRFQSADTVTWFEERGVALKTESDGRMFPTTDSSETIVDCLQQAAEQAGVQLRSQCGVTRIENVAGTFRVHLEKGEPLECAAVVLATGGSRARAGADMAASLGHTLQPPVPSLFAFDIDASWLTALAGIALKDAGVSLPGTTYAARGPLLITHKGISGPAVLRLSAWAARELAARQHQGDVEVQWLPGLTPDDLAQRLEARAEEHRSKAVVNTALSPIPARLWAALCTQAGVDRDVRWANMSRAQRTALVGVLGSTKLPMVGRSTNKDEFVTCGGVSLREIDMKTMESRVCPGLYVVGELLDVDAITGGFNFQSAWTSGWQAGNSLVDRLTAS